MTTRIPKHIGIIFDGNRRWAKALGKKSFEGHTAGAMRIFDFLQWCYSLNIRTVTLYLLSLENLSRDSKELKPLLNIVKNVVLNIGDKSNYIVNHLGSRYLLPKYLLNAIDSAKHKTKNNNGLKVNLAIGYSGRQEIVDAVKRYALAQKDLQTALQNIDIKDISKYLYIQNTDDPDLIIRTSGERRLSGFMLWQSTYSEFYFCEQMWPDFSKKDFEKAILDFSNRKRRFGI